MAIYGILVFKTHLSLKDGILAFVMVNVYYGLLHLLNVALDANYMYSRAKPEVASIMDVLGDWPTYIIGLEGIALLMILIIHLIMGRWLVPKKNAIIN